MTSLQKRRIKAHPARRRAEPRTRLEVDARRAQLVELGLEHFGRSPYDDVSIDAIASAARISKGLLYHYFPTKRAFYAASVREAAARLLAACDRAPDPGDAPPTLELLYAALDAYLSYVRAHGAAYATLMRSGVGVDPEIATIVDETRQSFVGKLMEGFTRSAILPPSPMVRIALRGWVGLAEATSLGWIEAVEADAPTAPTQSAIRDLLATTLVRLVETLSGGSR